MNVAVPLQYLVLLGLKLRSGGMLLPVSLYYINENYREVVT